MALFLVLPPEMHGAIFANVDPNSARQLASTCRLLRHWVAFGWRVVALPERPASILIAAVESLADVLAHQPHLAAHVRALVVRAAHEEDAAQLKWSLAPRVARILALVPNLRVLVLSDTPGTRRRISDPLLTALLHLPRLHTLSLAHLHISVSCADLTRTAQPAFTALRHVVVRACPGLPVAHLLRAQQALESVDVEIRSDLLDFGALTRHWPALRVLDASALGGFVPDDCVSALAVALDAGALRNLHTLAVRPEPAHGLSALLRAAHAHGVGLTALRVRVSVHYARAWGPAVLAEIFRALPRLERLCVDQTPDDGDGRADVEGDDEDDDTLSPHTLELAWRGSWNAICQAFAEAHCLTLFVTSQDSIAATFPADDRSSRRAAPVAAEAEARAQALFAACPPLKTVCFTGARARRDWRFTRRSAPSPTHGSENGNGAPVHDDNGADCGSDAAHARTRFWAPERARDVAVWCPRRRDTDGTGAGGLDAYGHGAAMAMVRYMDQLADA